MTILVVGIVCMIFGYICGRGQGYEEGYFDAKKEVPSDDM